ncbi:hypothetical protein [uncultured Winogradskyella sp.]|uniref:hypothetical protein n=1 Tax=uncultured Winogradskyella sp. TaxID=395353 RepID=UPI002626AF3E|nr:hypothetical protein [uncultured Winogradskyella sp.]
MKNLLGLLLILVTAFTSCEGRKTHDQSLAESIEEFNKKNTLIEKVSYKPEMYTEVATDTILSNGFKVNVKYFSDMNNQILDEVIQEGIIYKRNYREFIAQINISKNGKEIFNGIIDKNFIKTQKDLTPDFIDFTIMSNVLINFESVDHKNLNLEIWFKKIKTDIHKIYTLKFDKTGMYKIEDNGEIEF